MEAKVIRTTMRTNFFFNEFFLHLTFFLYSATATTRTGTSADPSPATTSVFLSSSFGGYFINSNGHMPRIHPIVIPRTRP